MSRTRDTDVWEDMETQLSYTYDESGRPKTVKIDKRNWWEPENETAVYTYNPVGSRKSLKYANGNYTEYIYDALNRLTTLTNYKTDAKTTTLSSFSYTHYDNGLRHTVTENVGENRTITYEYDNLNRVTSESGTATSGSYSTLYIYDIAGNRLSRTVQVNNATVGSQTLTTTYSHDVNTDRLLSESHSGPKWAVMLNDRPMYAYATGNRTIYKGSDGEIGEFKAFLLGLPTRLSQYGLGTVLAMLPVAFLAPAMMSLRGRRPKQSQRSVLWRRCLSVMLAYMMLISPVCLQSLVEGANLYSDLDSRHWAEGDTTIEYAYDANGSMTSKITKESDVEVERTIYEYNLQNRLATVKTSTDGGSTWDTITEYKYDPDGNRVQKTVDGVTTNYLIDSQNLTGYPQVFVEAPEGGNFIVNVVGDDIITQAFGSEPGDIQHLLYDGHGSTRQLSDSEGNLVTNESYSYDAYGVFLSGQRSTQTNLLYTGEQYDPSAAMYYLRARYYDPLIGRFNQTDPYAGSPQDPQSLHKYLYAHANPINRTDPSGECSYAETLTVWEAIGMMMAQIAPYLLGAAAIFWAARDIALVLEDILPPILDAIAEGVEGAQAMYTAVMSNTRAVVKAIDDVAKALKKTVKELQKFKMFPVIKRFVPKIFDFTVAALATHWQWFMLTYNGAGNPQTLDNRLWVRAMYGWMMASAPPGYQLDEFPYACTQQGGPGIGGGSALARPVPGWQNALQGGLLGAFTRWTLKGKPQSFIVVPIPL